MASTTFNGTQFTWRGNHGSTFSSDLGIRAGQQFPHSFYIKSQKTGVSFLFVPGEGIFKGEGEDREFAGQKYFVPGGLIEVTIWND